MAGNIKRCLVRVDYQCPVGDESALSDDHFIGGVEGQAGLSSPFDCQSFPGQSYRESAATGILSQDPTDILGQVNWTMGCSHSNDAVSPDCEVLAASYLDRRGMGGGDLGMTTCLKDKPVQNQGKVGSATT